MRLNLPVIDREYPFPPGQTLVSTTDLKGRILYCNPAFIEVSGYPRDELLGQPHNMIRHPDMPAEAFRDMWDTIAAGKPWSAPVKNRRKDGSCYWVMANVTPLMDGDRPVGYMSVRTQPERAHVEAATALYATMRAEGEAQRIVHHLQAGRLRVDTAAGRLRRMTSLDLPGRITAVAVGLSGIAFGAGLLAGSASPMAGGTGALAGAGLATLGIAAAGGWWLQRMTVKPLTALIGVANRMAAGDLTQRLETGREDVIGLMTRALNQLNVNLRSIVRDARNEVDHMRNATREIAAGNQDLSARTESQASSLEQTASSMEQITGTVRQSADAAEQASRLATEANAVTERSSAAVEQVTRTMQDISDSSSRIGEIIQVIDGIAFQTNILALNAAVEAARAGEQGRGFAVVAAEVRALSQRTTGAAREIKQLIGESSERVETGTRLVSAAQATMHDALNTVHRVGTLVAEISGGAREQLSGISQINEAVAQMDTITQQNAALVEQIAAAAVQLQGQAVTVADTVRVFRLDAQASHVLDDAVALRRAAKAQAPAVTA